MESEAPEFIGREELLELLAQQATVLPAQESLWWEAHHVDPFPVRSVDRWYYVVARDDEQVRFFADDEDEFMSIRELLVQELSCAKLESIGVVPAPG